ncbi:unnamed protein product [Paramecium primaurelia]|uniref:Protein kinase domain-containing protein n=1 Tax=Paramecium primaurelia TaxID=5886 RepID=A0A8S1Q1V2_PARPR|nr:unnamed protein product [Paramecium primaurelia]
MNKFYPNYKYSITLQQRNYKRYQFLIQQMNLENGFYYSKDIVFWINQIKIQSIQQIQNDRSFIWIMLHCIYWQILNLLGMIQQFIKTYYNIYNQLTYFIIIAFIIIIINQLKQLIKQSQQIINSKQDLNKQLHYQGLDMRNWIKENSQNFEERLVAQIIDIKLYSILIQIQLPSVILTNFCYSEIYISQTKYKKCGTQGFIAPEIFKTKLYTPKADIFSLGCLYSVLYFGKIPFSGSTQEEILQKNEAVLIDYKIQINLLKGLLISDPNQRLSAEQAIQHHQFIKMGTKQKEKFHTNIIKGKSLSTIIENSFDITHSILYQVPSNTSIDDRVEKEFTSVNLKDRLQKFNSIKLKPSKLSHQYYQ